MMAILPLVDGKNVGEEKPGVITLNASSSALIWDAVHSDLFLKPF